MATPSSFFRKRTARRSRKDLCYMKVPAVKDASMTDKRSNDVVDTFSNVYGAYLNNGTYCCKKESNFQKNSITYFDEGE